jgi:hypothetical protein
MICKNTIYSFEVNMSSLRNPYLLEYYQKCNELSQALKIVNILPRTLEIISNAADITALNEKIDTLKLDITTFISAHNLRPLIEDDIKRNYLDPIEQEFRNYTRFLLEQALTLFLERSVMTSQEKNLWLSYQPPTIPSSLTVGHYLDDYLEKELNLDKHPIAMSYYLQLSALDEISQKTWEDNELTSSERLFIFKELFMRLSPIFKRDFREQRPKVTSIWSTIVTLTEGVTKLLNNYAAEKIYLPPKAIEGKSSLTLRATSVS